MVQYANLNFFFNLCCLPVASSSDEVIHGEMYLCDLYVDGWMDGLMLIYSFTEKVLMHV